jgi:hypothetical protein
VVDLHLLAEIEQLSHARGVSMDARTTVECFLYRVPLEDLQLRTPGDSGSAALAALGTLEFRQHARRLASIFEGHQQAAPTAQR